MIYNPKTKNRDLRQDPITLKPIHIWSGDSSRITISADWIATDRFTIRKSALLDGSVLSLEWLRMGTKDLGDSETRLRIVSRFFNVKKDLRLVVELKDDKALASISKSKKFEAYTRTLVEFRGSNGASYTIYENDGDYLALDTRWSDLFTLSTVYRADSGAILDADSIEDCNVFFPPSAASVPVQASFAIFQAGPAPEPKIKKVRK